MATCPNCGYAKAFLRAKLCATCGRRGCERCIATSLGTTVPGAERGRRPVAACSWECFERWVRGQLASGLIMVQWGGEYMLGGIILSPEANVRASKLSAEHLVLAGRTEEAASIYERVGMWKEAGDTRQRAERHVVVHLDVDALLETVRKAGISTNYRCPACGGSIPIAGNTMPSALRQCEYCGSTIQTADLAGFLARIVGHVQTTGGASSSR